MDAWIKVEDGALRAALMHLIALGRDASPVMADIAKIGEDSTRARFRTQIAPDGTPWKPSLRAQLSGGRTLTKDGHLAQSVGSAHGKDYAEWGVNRIYAAIHQFGGVIKAKLASLRFRLANGAYATVSRVNMPPRPFLGVSDDDKADILDVTQRVILARLGSIERGLQGG